MKNEIEIEKDAAAGAAASAAAPGFITVYTLLATPSTRTKEYWAPKP